MCHPQTWGNGRNPQDRRALRTGFAIAFSLRGAAKPSSHRESGPFITAWLVVARAEPVEDQVPGPVSKSITMRSHALLMMRQLWIQHTLHAQVIVNSFYLYDNRVQCLLYAKSTKMSSNSLSIASTYLIIWLYYIIFDCCIWSIYR